MDRSMQNRVKDREIRMVHSDIRPMYKYLAA